MNTNTNKYVVKGEREKTAAVEQLGRYSSGLWDAYQKHLVECGLPAERGALIAQYTGQIGKIAGAQQERWDLAHAQTIDENYWIDRSKADLSTAHHGAKIVMRDTAVPGVTLANFTGLAELKRITPDIIHFIDNLMPSLQKLEKPLTPFFKGQSPVAVLTADREGLAKADQSQMAARTMAPDATAQLNELKGRLLEAIEDMNRVARIAFRGQAEVIARFNKDILLNARRSRPAAVEPTPMKATV